MKLFKTIGMVVALSMSATAFPQSFDINKAEQDFTVFQRGYKAGDSNEHIYEALLSAYKTYLGAISANAEEVNAINGLRKVYPYMIDGAIFFSQHNNNDKAFEFAIAYIDIPNMPTFSNERFTRNEYYPTICYFAATTAYNNKNFKDAIKCFRHYIESGDTKKLETAYVYMTRAYKFYGDVRGQLAATDETLAKYPNNINIAYEAINAAIETKDNTLMEKYVDAALHIVPGDPKVLPLKAKLLAEREAYAEAMPIFETLYRRSPKDTNIRRTYAQVAFNHAAGIINDANNIKDPKEYKLKRQLANNSLKLSAELFEGLLDESPNDIKYLSGLADTYKCMNKESAAKKLIQKIEALGGTYVATNVKSLGSPQEGEAEGEQAPAEDKRMMTLAETPSFAEYAKEFVEKDVNKWQLKDDYETLAEYKTRVNEKTRDERIKKTLKNVEKLYVDEYGGRISLDNLRLEKYDAENGVFLITSPYIGNLLLPVPRTNDEARNFEAQWNKVTTDSPLFCVANDKLALSQLTFSLPDGKQYVYHIDTSVSYNNTQINYNFNPLDVNLIAQSTEHGGQQIVKKVVDVGRSDVDTDIPEAAMKNENLFAVIIANENYRRETRVQFANNDGESFRNYCIQALGCPEKNVHYIADATLNDMSAELDWIRTVANAYDGQAKLIFYYAGHGVPNEATKSAYLLPVDGYGSNTNTGYSLDKLYATLGNVPAQQVTVFLDACFSGAQRDGSVMASSARGVAIMAKKSEPKGNMLVFSAASDSETAYPYKEKMHGLFTYFLLKKLKDTKGEASIGEIVDYVQSEVSKKSIVENNKSQTPSCSAAPSVFDQWRNWTLSVPAPLEEDDPLAE